MTHRITGLILSAYAVAAASAVADGPADSRTAALEAARVNLAQMTGAVGPDIRFCKLFNVQQLGRLGDVVGLSFATSHWNIGDRDLMYFASPDPRHPFLVMNLFRLSDDRLEQIGGSHAMHGFFALASHECGGDPCVFEPDHGPGSWLGSGCTTSSTASIHGYQVLMGPRYEIDPWSGVWTFEGSHLDGAHGHDPVQHRLQVHDADLDAALNPDADYFIEGYFVTADDVDHMNSASWRPLTVSGSPGATWAFATSGSPDAVNVGFAIDAWTGAVKTVIAQEVPPDEFESPDGRCVLAANATDLGGGTHHYEYALYNVDMDRQVSSFSIPLPPDATLTSVGFHAAEHHDEPLHAPGGLPIDNEPWTAEVTDTAITWRTTTNPLRWGTMYNFRFDADVPPNEDLGTVTLGLFKSGDPHSVAGMTVVPAGACSTAAQCPDADVNCDGVADGFDVAVVRAPGNWLHSAAGADEPRADVNGDGLVDGFDISVIRGPECWLQ